MLQNCGYIRFKNLSSLGSHFVSLLRIELKISGNLAFDMFDWKIVTRRQKCCRIVAILNQWGIKYKWNPPCLYGIGQVILSRTWILWNTEIYFLPLNLNSWCFNVANVVLMCVALCVCMCILCSVYFICLDFGLEMHCAMQWYLYKMTSEEKYHSLNRRLLLSVER